MSHVFYGAWLLSQDIMLLSHPGWYADGTLFLLMTERYSIGWLYSNVLTHFPLDGHLGCFHFGLLWIIQLWTFMFLCAYIFLILLGKYTGVEFLGHMLTLCLIFEQVENYFPKHLHQNFHLQYMKIPILLFSHYHLLLSIFFIISHPSRYEVVSHWSFAFP